jgi:scavenger receptor class B protein 1
LFLQDVEYSGISTMRFTPPSNVLGAHDDLDPTRRNVGNECYCLKDENYKCFKSGVLNLGPAQREDLDLRPPVALSLPHFYNADPSYVDAIEGMRPVKEKHEFFMDVVPRFGLPLAAQPRYWFCPMTITANFM